MFREQETIKKEQIWGEKEHLEIKIYNDNIKLSGAYLAD